MRPSDFSTYSVPGPMPVYIPASTIRSRSRSRSRTPPTFWPEVDSPSETQATFVHPAVTGASEGDASTEICSFTISNQSSPPTSVRSRSPSTYYYPRAQVCTFPPLQSRYSPPRDAAGCIVVPPPPPFEAQPPSDDNRNLSERFYFFDGNLSIVVQNKLYRIHRYLFLWHAGTSFTDMLHSPSSYSEENSPLCLTDVATLDFDRLLSILYPTDFAKHDCNTADEWTSVLCLATKWDMEKIRDLAVSKLGPLASAIDKVALGHEFGVAEWLASGYAELCTRRQPLTPEEGKKLGVDAMLRIAVMKHELSENMAQYIDDAKFSVLLEKSLSLKDE